MEVSSTTSKVAVERVVVTAFEAAALGVDFEQPVDGLGLETGRLGHALCRSAGRSTEQEAYFLRCENAQNGVDDRRLAHSGTAGDDQHLGHQCEPDRRYLAFGQRKPDTLFRPWHRLGGIDPGPRQRAARKAHQAFRDGALGAVQAGQKHTRRFANRVGNYRAFL